MPTIIWFIRHAQADNPHDIIYGRLPGFGLSKLGKKQAKKLASFFSCYPIKVIFSSPQLRCLETAKIISKKFPDIKIIVEKLLAEGEIGWEGKTKAQIIKSGQYEIYLKRPSLIQGKENFGDIANRAKIVTERILDKFSEQQVICVTHQDVIRSLRLLLTKQPIDLLNTFPCEKGSITKFIFNGNKFKKIKYYEIN
jgi:broad specificity phosphatase PhoE